MYRKSFISFFLLLVLISFPASGKKEKPELIVGILSDCHLKSHLQDSLFVKALEYFKMSDADAVMLVGDFTVDGWESEMAKTADLYFSVFPEDRGRRGKHVERIFVYGNHELEGHTYNDLDKKYSAEYIREHAILFRKEELWEKYWKQPFKPFYRVDVKGYTFLAGQYVEKMTSPGEIPGMEEFFNEVGPTLPKDKPIFYCQHKHPKWTCGYAQDNGKSTMILKKYPNLICFSGHCHSSLTDERSIWQGSFTSVNTSSLYRIGAKGGRENSKMKDNAYIPQMPVMWCSDGHHGMLMKVFADRVELHRYDFHEDMELGVWIIPNDTSDRPYRLDKRIAEGAENPPQFDESASIRTEKVLGKDRNNVMTEQMRVLFPAAVSTGGHPRAFDYKISVHTLGEDGSSTEVLSKLVFSPGFHHSESTDRRKGAKCIFSIKELPKGVPFRFAICPRDSFNNEGEAIYSKTIVL